MGEASLGGGIQEEGAVHPDPEPASGLRSLKGGQGRAVILRQPGVELVSAKAGDQNEGVELMTGRHEEETVSVGEAREECSVAPLLLLSPNHLFLAFFFLVNPFNSEYIKKKENIRFA